MPPTQHTGYRGDPATPPEPRPWDDPRYCGGWTVPAWVQAVEGLRPAGSVCTRCGAFWVDPGFLARQPASRSHRVTDPGASR